MKKIVLFLLAGALTFSLQAQDNPNPKSPTAKKDKKNARREQINKLPGLF